MDSEDDLDMLTALLAESEGVQEQHPREQADALDDLFDAEEEEEEEEEYKEGVEEEGPAASSRVEDTEEEEGAAEGKGSDEGARLGGSTVDLRDQLRRMQEQMQRLQQQLDASQKVSPSSATAGLTAGSSTSPKPRTPKIMTPKTMTPKTMTSKPMTPKPMSPTPITPKPMSPTPMSPTPITPKPMSPTPMSPTPMTSKPMTPTPMTPTPMTPTPPPAARPPTSKRPPAKPSSATQRAKAHAAAASPPTAASGGGVKLQESADFFDQLNNADSFKRKPRVAHLSTPGSPPEDRGPLMEIKIGGTFQPAEGGGGSSSGGGGISSTFKRSSGRPAATGTPRASSLPPLPKDVGVEKYSGLRLRKPRVSSSEMDRKMADRRRIRLSEVPERLAQEKLEDSDWVTFAVLVNKVTPQSNSSGKTFSIWKLSDLHNLEVFVSLLLFGEVHKELWKTEPGTVIGLLNPNPLKQKEGYDGVSLTVDNPQKVLLLGEAQDYSTCKAPKKNGDPCSQIVNTFECEYCQYHVKAQYKLMSSKRSELQSAYSGKVPGKAKGKGRGGGLRERLCQDGFYYGGVSSPACAASLASNPNKPVQKTLDKLFVKGAAQLVHQAKRLALQAGEVAGCSNEFKSLLSAPTPGALQLKKHLAQGGPSASREAAAPSFSASDLLKQQKRSQREFLQNRRRRVDEIQKRAPPSAAGPSAAGPSAAGTPSSSSSSSSPPTIPKPAPGLPRGPALGRGFAEGEDILFFENGPPPAAPAPLALSAAKMAAMRKLRAKGATGLDKEDPNAVKRKRSSDGDISARVEKSLTSPKGDSSGNEEEEPFQKRRREKLLYIQSEGFQKILNAKSLHNAALQAVEYQLQERYFDPLVKKEQMEEKMKGTREMKCRAVSCKKCNYTYFKPADRCVEEGHGLRWHDATKRFFKCPCGQRAIALDRLPHQHCSNCGLFKWERDGMLKEKRGPKIGGELLQPRGEEHGQFLNSMK